MKHALAAGLGLTEIIIVLLVALPGPVLMALFIIWIVRQSGSRRPRQHQAWPLAGNPSPFQVHQAVASRLQSVGVTPWAILADRPARNVTVELSSPASRRLDEEIRNVLAPLNVQVVWYEGSLHPASRSPEGESPS